MKKFLLIISYVIGMISLVQSQCSVYQIYESFTSTLPTQGGTWTANSMIVVTAPVRTGTHSIGFNGSGDWVRTPQISNPSILSFWYRRSSNSTAWTLNIQTSPDGTTWTTRGSITTVTTTYQQYTLNIGALSLTNVFIRLIDARSSGAHERYVDDLSITSTQSAQNSLLPLLSNCSYTLNYGQTYRLCDNGGPAGPIAGGYSNNLNRTVTILPSDATKKLFIEFLQMDLETDYDSLYVYNGPNISSPLILAATGTAIPSSLTSSATGGELTIRWKTDVSNIGAWGGFLIEAFEITALPVELTLFEAVTYPQWNVIKWTTASEHNSSYFDLQSSLNGDLWRSLAVKPAAGNSTSDVKYSWIDYNLEDYTYYKLIQFDIDGQYREYGPILAKRNSGPKLIIRYLNLMGQEVDPLISTGVLIEIYDDGSMRKIIR